RAELADENQLLGRAMRLLDGHVVLHQAPPARLVARDTNDGGPHETRRGKSREAALELLPDRLWVEGQRQGGHIRVACGPERVVHVSLQGASTSSHSCNNCSNWCFTEKRSSARARAAAPRRLRSSASRRHRSRAEARASASPAGVSRPVTPSSTSSGTPPTRVATTGTPHAAASMRLTGMPSFSLVN